LAALMMGRDKLFVCWLETVPVAGVASANAAPPAAIEPAPRPRARLLEACCGRGCGAEDPDLRLISAAAKILAPAPTRFDFPHSAIRLHELQQIGLALEAKAVDSPTAETISPCRFNVWSPCSISRRFGHALGRTRRSSMADLVDIADRVSARQEFSARILPSDMDIKLAGIAQAPRWEDSLVRLPVGVIGPGWRSIDEDFGRTRHAEGRFQDFRAYCAE
jgi:hypothetical protein